jgi:CubicO group peptidase (beta-lactamase class C family)
MLAELLADDPAYAHTRDALVVQRGRTLLELALRPADADGLVDTYSITKSVVATLAGLALDRGAIRSLDEPVANHLADARQPYTFRQLLTMTAGVETDGAWEIDAVMARPSGWLRWILSAPRRTEPGVEFAYDNGAAHVLGAAVAAAVGSPLSRFAARELFAPLGIDTFDWPRDPDGHDYGFGHLRLRPRDLAALGALYLNDGAVDGRRLVSSGFVAQATRAHTAGGPPEHAGYGFLWWVDDDPFPHFFAAGYAGQSLTVIPELELIAVTTGDERRLRPGWRNARHAVLEAFGSRVSSTARPTGSAAASCSALVASSPSSCLGFIAFFVPTSQSGSCHRHCHAPDTVLPTCRNACSGSSAARSGRGRPGSCSARHAVIS